MPGPTTARDQFRWVPLDGGQLFFHPQSGTHVRVGSAHLRHLRRAAPRVVMFGVTNACNLHCNFCSRDEANESRWTVDSAFDVLSGLSRAGTLEVAFGGGEPFMFPDFADLVTRLHAYTPLALNVTTNGALLDAESWRAFTGRFGQVRVSVYGDAVWRRCAELFGRSGQLWGANVLVDDDDLASLPELLRDLSDAGCNDASILGYVGEPHRVLSERGRIELAAIVAASPSATRVSVCFGGALQVPRLMAGFDNDGDCGAGSDFLSISADQRVRSCSFQDRSWPAKTASDVLSVWRAKRSDLGGASPRRGCARSEPQPSTISPLPEIAVWQSFSGNNSGECILVAKFRTVDDAEAYMNELLPGWRAIKAGTGVEDGFPAEWNELFASERVASASMAQGYREAPHDIVTIGSSVLAIGYGIDDMFPELRSLAWKRGAFVAPGGVHVHEQATLFAAIRTPNKRDREAMTAEASASEHDISTFVHGDDLYLHTQCDEHEGLSAIATTLRSVAGACPVSAELFYRVWQQQDLVDARKRVGDSAPVRRRLWVQFFRPDENAHHDALAFAQTFSDQSPKVGKSWVMLDPVLGRKRVSVLAYRRGASVTALDAERVRVRGYFWRPRVRGKKGSPRPTPKMPTADVIAAGLSKHGPLFRGLQVASTADHNSAVAAHVTTESPGRALQQMEELADALGLLLWPSVSDPDALGAMLRRLKGDVARPVR